MEFGVGSILDGKVTGITKFGAFVALPEGRSGLVHISEIAYSYVNEVSDYLKEGQEVKVKVIGIDQANRINLSIKKANDPPQRAAGGAQGGRPPRQGGPRSNAPRSGGYAPRPAVPKEPTDFEDRLRQFMQASDSKLSELRYLEKKVITRENPETARVLREVTAAAGNLTSNRADQSPHGFLFPQKKSASRRRRPVCGGEMCRLVSCNQKVP